MTKKQLCFFYCSTYFLLVTAGSAFALSPATGRLAANTNPHEIQPYSYQKEGRGSINTSESGKGVQTTSRPRVVSIFSEQVTIEKTLGFFEDNGNYPPANGFLDNVEFERMKKRKQQLQ